MGALFCREVIEGYKSIPVAIVPRLEGGVPCLANVVRVDCLGAIAPFAQKGDLLSWDYFIQRVSRAFDPHCSFGIY